MQQKIIFVLLLLIAPYAFSIQAKAATAEVQSKVTVDGFCATYTGQTDFLVEMSKKILKDNGRRAELVKLMSHDKAEGCRHAITDYLNEFIENSSVDATDLQTYLLLAFAAKLPVATELIKKEITEGKLIDYLDVFEKSDKEAYFAVLEQWVERVGALVRQVDHAEKLDEKLYGKISQYENEIKTPESIPIWNPMLIDKYMTEIVKQKIKLTKNDFADLNIIYAASNQSYREVFLTKMSSVISLAQTNWMTSFRTEPPWVQFRLLPVMGKVSSSLMKRELIWLSQYHQNFKIRSVAEATLEKAAVGTNPKENIH